MGQEDKKTDWNLLAKMLAGEASPAERCELEKRLKENPELHYPMQTINDLWKSSQVTDGAVAEAAYNRHLDRLRAFEIEFPVKRTGGRRRGLLLGGLSTLVLLAGLVAWWNSGAPRPASVAMAGQSVTRSAAMPNEIATANGSRTHQTLPDGTLVWLNAGSRLVYGKNYNGTRREVSLTGEAFFDVAKNSQKPFVIHTERIDIKVLGTSFNVKSYPTDNTTEATLIRGSIEVSIRDRPSEKIILKPNQKLVVGSDDSLQHTAKPQRTGAAHVGGPLVSIRPPTYEQATGAIIETAWVDNKLTFKAETFGELARRMERWYGITIVFSDPALEQLEFTGSFKEETIEQALEALRLTANFRYSIDGNRVTIINGTVK